MGTGDWDDCDGEMDFYLIRGGGEKGREGRRKSVIVFRKKFKILTSIPLFSSSAPPFVGGGGGPVLPFCLSPSSLLSFF